MKEVCVHANLGPFVHVHYRMYNGGITAATKEFRRRLQNFYGDLNGIVDRTGEDYRPTVDIYPLCNDCNAEMNFHDYPAARYQIGNRGGISKVAI